MKGIARLNDYHIPGNVAAGSHDPGMMWDPVTETYYSYSTDVKGPALGVPDEIGIPIRSSKDLVHFKYEGTALSKAAIAEGRDNGKNFKKTVNFWAPFTEYVKGEYRMYYSATKAFGSSESRIWLAVADHPLGPFENRGIVADTWGTDDTYPNAIDAHVIWEDDKAYLIYGSFFGGIYIKMLDPETGLAADGNPKNLGICISRKGNPARIDGPEGASVIYHPETGYYYLFQSYGWLGNNYDIRVGRSKVVTGPYADRKGRNLVEEALGEKLANSYRFEAENPYAGKDQKNWVFNGLRGPGHGVPFFDPNRKAYFFVHHIRDGARCNMHLDPYEHRESYSRHYMVIRPMFFLEDGWPVLGPEPYTGESLEAIKPEDAEGIWELIKLGDQDNWMKQSYFEELKSDDFILENAYMYRCWDYENQKDTMALTGVTREKVCVWGKLALDVSQMKIESALQGLDVDVI